MDTAGDADHRALARDLVLTCPRTEAQALILIQRIADHFGMVIAYWSAWDIEMRLAANHDDGNLRHLTAAQWRRVTRTPAWRAVAPIAYDTVADSGILTLAVRQAGLECIACGAALPADAPTTDTLLRCDQCRADTTTVDIVRRPCPADAAGHHQPRNGHCAHCGAPMSPHPHPANRTNHHSGVAHEPPQDLS